MKNGAFIVPTGIGASIGGYAGDASFWARKFAEKSLLIVNPNVVNAACFSGITDNMLYVEGYSLDIFFKGEIDLLLSKKNKIGVVFDKAMSKEILNLHINTINAVKTIYNINIIDYEITKENVGVNFFIEKSGNSVGNVNNLNTIEEAAIKLLKKGANAIAIVCLFPEEDNSDIENNYSQGKGVDPVGGVEAIISHYISKELHVPCAHAPAFEDITIPTELVSEKCAAEYITPTFLPSILIGLNNAPQISKHGNLNIDSIDYLIVPYNSIGNIPVLEMIKREKTVFAVKENITTLNVTPTNFCEKCIVVNTYKDLYQQIFQKK